MSGWPLLGRRAELEQLTAALMRGPAGALVVTGAAGVGKTRLAAAAVDAAARRGVVVHRVAATSAAATIPFGPCAALLPERAGAPSEAGLLRVVAADLAARAGGRRVVVWVDDAHVLDPGSAALVHHLAVGSPVAVLCTVRRGEPAPDAIAALVKDGVAQSWELAPLDPPVVGELLERVLGGQVDGALVAYLARLSGGNPLLLCELVTAARAAGAVGEVAGIWRGTGAIVGRDLPGAVRARLDLLPDTVRQAAELVALAEPLDLDLAEALGDPDALEAAERAGLLDAGDGTLRLAHPLYAEALRAALSPLRVRSLSRRLADATEALARPADALRRAGWQLDAGLHPPADDLLAAAHHARRRFAHAQALRLAEAAVDAGGGFDAELLVAQLLPWLGRARESDERFAALAKRAPDPGRRDRAIGLRVRHLCHAHGDIAAAVQLLDTLDPGEAARLAPLRAGALIAWGDVGGALAASAGQDEHAGPRAATARAMTLLMSGRLTDGLRLCEAVAPTVDEPHVAITLGSVHSAVLGNLRGMQAGLAACRYGDALAGGTRFGQAVWAMNVGTMDLYRGRPRTAARMLRESMALSSEPGAMADIAYLTYVADSLVEAAALVGDLAEADRVLAMLRSEWWPRLRYPLRSRGEAWLLAARGDLPGARRSMAAAAEVLRASGGHLERAQSLHDLVRLGAPDEAAAELAALCDVVDGPLVRVFARHASALATEDGAGLVAVADRLAELGFELQSAEAYAHAAALGGGTAARARGLVADCEGARTPALREVSTGPSAALTRREREIAGLAATGLSDREIAQRLVLSERTVHSHLHRAYAKLGVRGRGELPGTV